MVTNTKLVFFWICICSFLISLSLWRIPKWWSSPTYDYKFCELFDIEIEGRSARSWAPNPSQQRVIRTSADGYEFICAVKGQDELVNAIYWDRGEFSYSSRRFQLQYGELSDMGWVALNYKKYDEENR